MLFKCDDEPFFEGTISNIELSKSYNFYHAQRSKNDSMDYLIEHLKLVGENNLAFALEKYNFVRRIVPSFGFLCRMIDRGLVLSDEGEIYYNKKIEELTKIVGETLFSIDDDKRPIRKKRRGVKKEIPFLKYCEEYSFESKTPYALMKANEAWLLNVKTKNIGVLRSSGNLRIKGNTVYNFTFAKRKRIKKPEDILSNIGHMTNDDLMKIFKSINTKENVLTGRLNCNTLIIALFNGGVKL